MAYQINTRVPITAQVPAEQALKLTEVAKSLKVSRHRLAILALRAGLDTAVEQIRADAIAFFETDDLLDVMDMAGINLDLAPAVRERALTIYQRSGRAPRGCVPGRGPHDKRMVTNHRLDRGHNNRAPSTQLAHRAGADHAEPVVVRLKQSPIDQNPHRDLKRYPPNPEQVQKLIESIGRTGFWNNLVVRPHPEQEGRYQLAYGHNRIEACKQARVTEAELEVIELSDYDMLCCMADENLTQQHVVPKTIFEIVAAAIKEAEKMLRASHNVHEFNAGFKRSRGLETLLQKSNCPDPDNAFRWQQEHYDRAKEAIEPSGHGLGRGFLQHFLPPHSVASNSTLQATIAAYYQEEWRKEGDRLTLASQALLQEGKVAEAQELEKQARVLLGQAGEAWIDRESPSSA